MANYGIDEPIPEYFKTSLPTPAGNVAPSSFASNLGGLLFAGGDSGLSDYLTAEQQKQMQRQALMQAAMSLLKSGRTSTTPIGLGEALGSAYEAGQQGYQGAQTNAIQQLLTKQKLDEYKRQVADQEAYSNMFAQMPTAGAAMTPEQALSVGGGQAGPTPQRAAMIGMPAPAGATTGGMPALSQIQRDILRRMTPKEGRAELLKMSQPEEFGAPQPQVVNGQIQMVQYNKKGEPRVVSGAMPYEPQSQDIRAVEYITGQPLAGRGTAGITEVGQYRQQIAPKTTVTVPVDMTGGQKGFENEMKLGSAFKSEPIYKEFQGMKTAFTQVNTALDAGTPIGDLAGATKMMKLMDEGSVVRESELALAMAAAGRMDRLKNYISQSITGEKLTPTQRQDFKQLSTELYAAAADAYNIKRSEYEGFGQSYNFKNLGTALGPKVEVPSIVRKTPAAAPAGAAKPKVGRLVTDPKTGGLRYVEE